MDIGFSKTFNGHFTNGFYVDTLYNNDFTL